MPVPTAVPPRASWANLGSVGFDPLPGLSHLGRPAADLLAEADRQRIPRRIVAGLDDVVRFFRSPPQHQFKMIEGGDERLVELNVGGNVDRGRDDVVAALAHVDIVIRMHRSPGPGNLRRPGSR